jgi:hypothetical protein
MRLCRMGRDRISLGRWSNGSAASAGGRTGSPTGRRDCNERRSRCGATRAGVLVNPANTANAETTLRDVEPAARAVGLQNPDSQSQQQPGDRCGLRNFRAGAGRRPLRGRRPFFVSRRIQLVHLATRHQPPDRQDARPHRAGQAARCRRRGDRIELLFAAVH